MPSHRIDVHHHVIPGVYLEEMERAGVTEPIPGVDYPTWTVESDLEVMDRNGIRTALLSITAPGVQFTDGTDAVRVARRTNDFLAQLVSDHPHRYGAFALMPLPDVDATLHEIDRSVDELGLDGVGLFTNHRGVYLGDPAFDRVLAALAERDILTFVHPATPPATDQPRFGLPPSLYEFTFDTTRMIANLLFSGTLDRHPGLRLVVSHAGGAIPYLATRLTYADTINSRLAPRTPKDLLGSLRGLYYDTAMSANRHTLAALTSLVPADHILFGSDYPFMPESTTIDTVAGVRAAFTGPALAGVERGNAARLVPRLATVPAATG